MKLNHVEKASKQVTNHSEYQKLAKLEAGIIRKSHFASLISNSSIVKNQMVVGS